MEKGKYHKTRVSKGKAIDTHRLVMERHLGRKLLPGEVVHHKDRNKSNNCIDNLQVMTRREHGKEHAGEQFRHGFFVWNASNTSRGEQRSNSKLTEDDVRAIRADQHTGIRELGRRYGVAHTKIIRIKRNEVWKHVA